MSPIIDRYNAQKFEVARTAGPKRQTRAAVRHAALYFHHGLRVQSSQDTISLRVIQGQSLTSGSTPVSRSSFLARLL